MCRSSENALSKRAGNVFYLPPAGPVRRIDLRHVEAAQAVVLPRLGQIPARRIPQPPPLGGGHRLPGRRDGPSRPGLDLHEAQYPVRRPGDQIDLPPPAAVLPLHYRPATALQRRRHGGLSPVAPAPALIHAGPPPIFSESSAGGWDWVRTGPASHSAALCRIPCAARSGTPGTFPPSPPYTGPGSPWPEWRRRRCWRCGCRPSRRFHGG